MSASEHDITRFEVIDETGRAYTRIGVAVRTVIQDEGHTMKVFVKSLDPEEVKAVRDKIAEGWRAIQEIISARDLPGRDAIHDREN